MFSQWTEKSMKKPSIFSLRVKGFFKNSIKPCEQCLWGSVPLSYFHFSESLRCRHGSGSKLEFLGNHYYSLQPVGLKKPPSFHLPAAVLIPHPSGRSRWRLPAPRSPSSPLLCHSDRASGTGTAAPEQCWPHRRLMWWRPCWSVQCCDEPCP